MGPCRILAVDHGWPSVLKCDNFTKYPLGCKVTEFSYELCYWLIMLDTYNLDKKEVVCFATKWS